MRPRHSTLIGASIVTLLTLPACGSDANTASSQAATTVTAATAVTSTNGSTTTLAPAATASTDTAASESSTVDTTVGTATGATTSSSDGTDTTPAIVAATNAFLDTLTDDERSAVTFDFTDTAQRQKWSNLPEGLFSRDGLMWGNLSEATQNAWLAVMKVTLSAEGYQRVIDEWHADEQLAAGGGNSYGIKYYWIGIIGEPSATAAWQWQFGGHHVTINATIKGSDVSLNPSFIGVQPATYTANCVEVRPLGDIVDEAFALVNSLDATEQSTAIISDQLMDLVLGPGQDGKTVANEGIAGADMTADQQAALLQLMDHYGNLANAEDAASRLADLKSNLADTYFAWAGPTTAGSGIYFRITGPTVVIEYSGQSMGGNTAEHIHGIYRDPTNDYGAAFGAGLS